MAMEAAIQTITYSIHRNFILQNIDFLSMKIEKDVSITTSTKSSLSHIQSLTPVPPSNYRLTSLIADEGVKSIYPPNMIDVLKEAENRIV